MTEDERIDRVAARMARYYGLTFSDLRDEPEQEGFQDLQCKAFWRELAYEATDEWEKMGE